MAKFRTFEELEVWKSGMSSCEQVYALTENVPFTKDYNLKDQIRRSAISIPSNIAEGFERSTEKQFIYFLVIAKGSCGELRTQLNLANRLNYINTEFYNQLNNNCISISKQLSGFINYLKTKGK